MKSVTFLQIIVDGPFSCKRIFSSKTATGDTSRSITYYEPAPSRHNSGRVIRNELISLWQGADLYARSYREWLSDLEKKKKKEPGTLKLQRLSAI